MNSRANLSNSNLIKKLLIGLTLCLMMLCNIFYLIPEKIYASPYTTLNRTMYLYSEHKVEIIVSCIEDTTANQIYVPWDNNAGLGEIYVSPYGIYNGKKGFKIDCVNVNLTNHSPFCKILQTTKEYKPTRVDIVTKEQTTASTNLFFGLQSYAFDETSYYNVVFEKTDYNIYYDLNGGISPTPFNTQLKKKGEDLNINTTIPTKLGCKFIGWMDSDGDIYGGVGGKSTYNKDKEDTLIAQWGNSEYKIIYNPNKPSSATKPVTGTMDQTTATFGIPFNLAGNNYELEGWEFTGWNTRADGKGVHYGDGQEVWNLNTTNNGTTTLYAEWGQKTQIIKLNEQAATTSGTTALYSRFDNGFYKDASCTQEITNIDAPERMGFKFDGYYTEKNGKGTKCIDSADVNGKSKIIMNANLIDSDTEIYAYWTPAIYTVSLNDGTTTISTIYEKFDDNWCSDSSGTSVISNISVPQKSNYTFGGYYSEEITDEMIHQGEIPTDQVISPTGKILVGPTQFCANTTLYAYWIPNSYLITLDGNGATYAGTTSLQELYGIAWLTGKNKPVPNGGTMQKNYTSNRNWQYFIVPIDGYYTFSTKTSSETRYYTEGTIVKIFARG